ncbi:helix-turn-helix domain-containing protein [Sideroxydans sp. CL21]|uniref:helix-turn-helix domain-containing protein n=1 Tax=Sideroxydans sp. CL21 TaxID=2600596 RepID=UPI0024BD4FCE|nr:helix-turn-helix domain-containing protein [Sideroxydans sp. CL21]
MSIVDRHLDLASVQSAWQDLNKLVPLGAITGEKDYKRRVSVMDELLDRIGANESHRLMPLLDLVTKDVEAYEAKQQALPEAAPADVLAFLMEEHNLKQTDLAEELGGQSIVSAILNGKRELNTRQVKALAARFNVSPAVFL